MSRSIKKTPKIGMTRAKTEKEDKRKSNRKFRRVVKVRVKKEGEMPLTREVSNVWLFDKDGKQFLKNPAQEYLRK